MIPSKPIRVLVDLTRLRSGGDGGGIKPALLGMLRWLGRYGGGRLQFVYITSVPTLAQVHDLASPADLVITPTNDPADLAARYGCDVVYCPFGFTDFACPGIPTITLVVDLLHKDYLKTMPEPDRIYRDQGYQAARAVTDRYQVISDFTAARLLECYGVTPARIFRTYLPVHERLTNGENAPRSPSGSGRPYFLYPAKFWLHKNHEVLLQAYALYRHQSGADAWSLVLAGYTNPARQAHLEHTARSLRIEANIMFAGYVSEAKLAELYRAAGALAFPSLYEGFGIPLIEAMAHDIPIIASRAAAIPEVVGSAAILVDAQDPIALAGAMQRLAGDAGLRATLVKRGQVRLADFSPDAEFGRLLAEIERAAQLPARWQRSGYSPIDGLTAPLSIFGLPRAAGEITLRLSNRPLWVNRTLQLFCGRELLAERFIPAHRAAQIAVTFRPAARAVTLRVMDASSLCSTDPRIHGILLDSLRAETADGKVHNLLATDAPFELPPDQLKPQPDRAKEHSQTLDPSVTHRLG